MVAKQSLGTLTAISVVASIVSVSGCASSRLPLAELPDLRSLNDCALYGDDWAHYVSQGHAILPPSFLLERADVASVMEEKIHIGMTECGLLASWGWYRHQIMQHVSVGSMSIAKDYSFYCGQMCRTEVSVVNGRIESIDEYRGDVH